MNKSLNKHLEQISRLISGLQNEDVDLEKLTELDRSLDLLSNKIKTSRLDNYSEKQTPQNQNLKQDAVFYFDNDYNIIRFVGDFENIIGRHLDEKSLRMDGFMQQNDFEKLKKYTEILNETNEPQHFTSNIISQNGISLQVNILLEMVSFNRKREVLSAGMMFYHETFSDLEDYREILLENLPGIDVYLFDNRFRHVLSGGNEKRRMGLSNADFSGRTLFEVFDEKIQKRLFPFYRNALDGKISEGEVRIRKEIYFVSVTPVYGINKQVVGGALVLQNVTREKEVERNLIKAKREAEEADKAKSIFLASMSHEIRTPLNAIIGFTNLLNKTELDSKQKNYSELIGQSSEHLLSVVNEVLFLFKLGMGKVMIEKVTFNPRELVHNVEESLRMRAADKNLGFYFSISDDIPEMVVGDSFRLKQILINLITNAIKYTEEGEINVRVLAEKKTKRKVFLRFEVEDTGIGIAKKDLNAIFEVFSQPGIKNDKASRGAGLGLTIVQKLVDLLDGRLHVDSNLGKGSEFMVVVPFLIPKEGEEKVEEKEYDLKFNQLKGKRILYADDDENNLLLGKSILSDWMVDYKVARDGAEAFDLMKSEQFDIVLLDIHMPLLTGVDVIKKIRKNSNNPNNLTKVIAVTANVMENDLENYISSGFDDYMLKPFKENKLYNKICQLLNLEYIDVQEVDAVTDIQENSEKNHDLKGKDIFNTSELMTSTGGNKQFFNQMLDTFIKNTEDSVQNIELMYRQEDWEGIAQKAHKAIPSFRYFKLNNLVNDLTRLEELGLHEKNYEPMKTLSVKVKNDITHIIEQAKEAKIS
jgi:signal transduction histidine kinase/DNA-binding response OmpR family regulator